MPSWKRFFFSFLDLQWGCRDQQWLLWVKSPTTEGPDLLCPFCRWLKRIPVDFRHIVQITDRTVPNRITDPHSPASLWAAHTPVLWQKDTLSIQICGTLYFGNDIHTSNMLPTSPDWAEVATVTPNTLCTISTVKQESYKELFVPQGQQCRYSKPEIIKPLRPLTPSHLIDKIWLVWRLDQLDAFV